MGVVEGKQARRYLRVADPADVARELLRKGELISVFNGDGDKTVGKPEGRLHGIGQAVAEGLFHHEAVYDHLDIVFLVLIERDLFVQRIHAAVHPDPEIAGAPERLELALVFALSPLDDRGQHRKLRAGGKLQDVIDDALDGDGGDLPAAVVAEGMAHAGKEKPQIVVYLGDGADGGAGVLAGGLLLDGDGRGKPLDEIDVGLIHLLEELPGVGRQGLHVAALPLGIDRIKRERGFAGAGKPRDDDELIPGDDNLDILEIMFPGALYPDMGLRHADHRLQVKSICNYTARFIPCKEFRENRRSHQDINLHEMTGM